MRILVLLLLALLRHRGIRQRKKVGGHSAHCEAATGSMRET